MSTLEHESRIKRYELDRVDNLFQLGRVLLSDLDIPEFKLGPILRDIFEETQSVKDGWGNDCFYHIKTNNENCFKIVCYINNLIAFEKNIDYSVFN